MDADPEPPDLAALLSRAADGFAAAESELFEGLQQHLRRLARASLRRQGPGHTLQTTALVNEAWLRLLGAENVAFESREHFLAIAARAMRFVLVDHARKKGSDKRGGDRKRLPIEVALELYEQRSVDVLELNDALDALAEQNERRAKIVELRFFGGLTVADTAKVLGVSEATVERDWRMARLFLLAELGAA